MSNVERRSPKEEGEVRKPRIIVARKMRRGQAKAEEFDKAFWDRLGHEAKFAATWEMVNEVRLFRGQKDAGEQRLQRTVQNIQRRKC